MTFIVKDTSEGRSFEPISEGMHQAVCYGVVDIGTPPQFGKWPARRKVLFLWEVPGERIELDKDGKKLSLPRAISQKYTMTLASKGNLRPMLESWRGRKFTPEELAGFNLEHVVGVNCLLNIVHNQGSGENANRIYANVETVNPLMKGMVKIKLENPAIVFFMGDVPQGTPIEFPANMPEWIQKTIQESDEWKDHLRPAAHQPERGPQPAFDPNEPDDGSEIPF